MQLVALPHAISARFLPDSLGMARHPEQRLAEALSTDSFAGRIAQAPWAQELLADAPRQVAVELPRFKGAPSCAGGADTQRRRDDAPCDRLTAPGEAHQAGDGAGSEAAASGSAAAGSGEEAAQPARRGRGRQRKARAGPETAQQRAHRRFYERKKQRMAALEQEAADKAAEHERLLAENAELRRKHEALERAVAGRDEHMTLMAAMGSLSLEGAGQLPAQLPPLPPAAQQLLAQLPPLPGALLQQQPQQQQPLGVAPLAAAGQQPRGVVAHHSASHSGPPQLGHAQDDWQQQLGSLRRLASAPAQQQQQQLPPGLLPEVQEAGPFGMIQLPQLGVQDDAPLPPPAATADDGLLAPPLQAQQPPPPEPALQQFVPWIQPLPGLLAQEEPLSAWEAQLRAPLTLTRSSSMPARTCGADASTLADASLGAGLGAASVSRCFSSSPQAWHSRTLALAAGGADLPPPALSLAGIEPAGASEASPWASSQLAAGVARAHSWAGAATPGGMPLLPRGSSSFGPGPVRVAGASTSGAPEPLPAIPQLPPALGFEVAASAGGTAALAAAAAAAAAASRQPAWQPAQQQQQQQQQQQEAGMRAALAHTITTIGPLAAVQQQEIPRSSSDPLAGGVHGQSRQPWQQQLALPGMQATQAAQAAAQLPQQLEQQLQQGFAAMQPALLGALDDSVLPTELLMVDEELMELLDKTLSQQQSFEMLSPLPSLPSLLPAGDEQPAAPAPPAPAGEPQQQQQQQQQQQHAASLLEASRQLQARHEAAGLQAPSGPNDILYVHQMVDWYRSKLLLLMELLPHVDRPQPDAACSVALVQAMEDIIDGTRRFGTRNRLGVFELKLINLQTGELADAPRAHWRAVADAIQLPPGMRESALACYSLYLEYVGRVRTERQAVLHDLASLEAGLAASAQAGAARAAARGYGGAGAPASLQFRADGYEAYTELVERLALSLRQEHMVTNVLTYSLGQIASHVQMAKGILACWPYWPDAPSILSLWLEDDAAAAARPGGAGLAAWGASS